MRRAAVAVLLTAAACSSFDATPGPTADAGAPVEAGVSPTDDGGVDAGAPCLAFFCDPFPTSTLSRRWEARPSEPAPVLTPDGNGGFMLTSSLAATTVAPLPHDGDRVRTTISTDQRVRVEFDMRIAATTVAPDGSNFKVAAVSSSLDRSEIALYVSVPASGPVLDGNALTASADGGVASFASMGHAPFSFGEWVHVALDVAFAPDAKTSFRFGPDLELRAVPLAFATQPSFPILELGVARPNSPTGALHVDYDNVVVTENPQ